jgi:type II secretory pathway predicted ATPase ExeA
VIGQLVRRIRFHYIRRRVLLILDEAQHLDNDALETVRELLDEPPYFGMLFAGSHQIQQKFVQLEMEQWRSRLQSIVTLDGLNEAEIEEIATGELGKLTQAKIQELKKYCRVQDYRQRNRFYYSARNLFFALDQIKAAKAEQEGASA